MRSYAAARTYFSILEFVSWCIIVLGAIVALVAIAAFGQMSRSFGGSSMAGLAGLIPGASVVFAGFMGLVVAQIGRAGVDSAEYGQQMLKIARDQLEVSQQALRGGAKAESGFAALNKKATEPEAEATNQDSGIGYSGASQQELDGPGEIAQEPKTDFSYRGRRVRVTNDQYLYNGLSFPSEESVKRHLDQQDGIALLPENRPGADQKVANATENGSEKA